MPVSRSVTQFASLASLLSFVPAPRHHRPWTVPSARALVPSDNPQDNDLTRSAGSPTPPPRPESSRCTLDRGLWRFEEESGRHLPKEWSVSPNLYTHTRLLRRRPQSTSMPTTLPLSPLLFFLPFLLAPGAAFNPPAITFLPPAAPPTVPGKGAMRDLRSTRGLPIRALRSTTFFALDVWVERGPLGTGKAARLEVLRVENGAEAVRWTSVGWDGVRATSGGVAYAMYRRSGVSAKDGRDSAVECQGLN
jgi:hypothetical protein